MTKKTRKLLQPQYVSKFHCIGPVCEDSCCNGWLVHIDRDTYKRYRKCKDKCLRPQLDEKVTRNRIGGNDVRYAKIRQNTDGNCPFLDEDQLCKIQSSLGQEHLSIACAAYPRMANIVNGITEKSLTMSCPEAARLALLNPELMSFDETEEDVLVRNNQDRIINTRDIKATYKPQRYFWELRVFIISLLQDRTYELWQRLIILGLFCRKVDHFVRGNNVHDIPQLIGMFLKQLESGAFSNELDAIPNEITIQMQLIKEVVDQRIFEGINSTRFLKCFTEFLYGVQYTADASKEEIGQRYAEAYDIYFRPKMEQHAYIFENYLVNYVFRNLFPFSGEKRIFDNYVMLVMHYAIIKMLLIGMAGFHKNNFGIDHMIKLIQSFSKTIEHKNTYLKRVSDLLKANDFNTMPYMAILVKTDSVASK